MNNGFDREYRTEEPTPECRDAFSAPRRAGPEQVRAGGNGAGNPSSRSKSHACSRLRKPSKLQGEADTPRLDLEAVREVATHVVGRLCGRCDALG